MAIKSLRKKSNKRSSNSNPYNSPSNSMAPPATSFLSTHRMVPLLISAVLFVCILIVLSISSNMRSALGSDPNVDRIYSGEVVNRFPHDPNAFTQGLLYGGNDTLFESTGLNGHSSVRRVALQTGKVEAIHRMQDSYFGEGLTLFGDRLFQVTWLTKTGFVYDRNNLSKIGRFSNQMKDGWGLATDGKVLFGSDGTSTLYKIDPQTLKVFEKHTVKYQGDEVHNLNELEYVNGEVWANVWQTDCIARLSSKGGVVLGWIYLPNLREELIAAGNMGIDVLNGIAWDQERNRLFVTGKLWPKLYEIKLHPMKKPFHGDIKSLCMPPPVHFGRP
ncbi:Glutaminyl-peptide cyclotransferase [Sesamum alatum]|uniref:Glutaminyl-peptide cyclotransferase n=1 Tax=Sesamum alatum TaxID=300844 RepID=A0AAE1YJM2_9LAMI|nr:Glutaminyl-peptide cyclotransferase [Sesamum alatum]